MTSWSGPQRLRTRVTLLASIVSFVLMSLAALAMVLYQREQLYNAVDVSLEESVTEVTRELDISFGRTDRPGSGPPTAADLATRVANSNRSIQLLDREGEVLAASGSLANEEALIDDDDLRDISSPGFGELETVEGEFGRYRVATIELGKDRILVAGYSLADVDQSLRIQGASLIVGIPILSAFVGLLVWIVLGRALKPVEAIRSEVANIGAEELGRRVPVPSRSIELASLATTMNEMLDRLNESADRQNRFVSDAAHELRSPLAGIRGQLEVNIHHPEAPEQEESELAMLSETIRMQTLVDDLLLLARSDHGTRVRPLLPVDLDDLVLEEAESLRRISDHAINLDEVSAAQVLGDSNQLRRVIRNLGDNAIRHATSTISFALHEEETSIRLAVTDDGPGILPEDAEAVFSRFTRLDEARDRDMGGSGLGLAISREIVDHHGGSIEVDTSYTGGARLIVRLPRP